MTRAGVPIAKDRVSGEQRYRVLSALPVSFRAGEVEGMALRLARRVLTPFEGSTLVSAIDARLNRDERPDAYPFGVRVGPAAHPEIVRAVESATRDNRVLHLRYRGRDGSADWHEVEPLGVYYDRGLYLVAHCRERDAMRTFKLARIEWARAQDTSFDAREFDPDEYFARSVRVWRGEPVTVRVRLSQAVAGLAAEYPLVEGQTLERERDGVLVSAEVAGITEAMRWVLGWGADAEVVEPAALRAAVRDELLGALRWYPRPLRAGGDRGVSQELTQTRGMVE